MKNFEKKFLKVAAELEEFCKSFVVKGVPEEYKGIWVPKNEIRAWAVPHRSAEVLRMFVLASKPKTILELGTSFGYSTIWLASGAREFGGKVYTIELTKPKIKKAAEFFKKSGLMRYIDQIEGEVSRVLVKWNKKIDFVFLDADKQNYLSYIKKMEPHFKKGTIIIADNATDFAPLMKSYLKYVTTSPCYHSYLLNVDNGLMISVYL